MGFSIAADKRNLSLQHGLQITHKYSTRKNKKQKQKKQPRWASLGSSFVGIEKKYKEEKYRRKREEEEREAGLEGGEGCNDLRYFPGIRCITLFWGDIEGPLDHLMDLTCGLAADDRNPGSWIFGIVEQFEVKIFKNHFCSNIIFLFEALS